MKSKSPCLGCKDRRIDPSCHNVKVCQKWAEYQEKMEKERALLMKAREKEADEAAYIMASIRRSRRKTR